MERRKNRYFPDIFNVAHASLVCWPIIVYNIIYNHVQYSLLPSSFYKHNIQSAFLSFQDWFGLEESTWCPTLLTIITTTTPIPIRLVKTNERELRGRECFRNHWCGLVDDSKYPPGHQVIPREVYQGAISFTHVVSQTCFSFFFSWQIELTKKKKSIWALGTVIHGAYIIAQNFSIPLQVQPQVFAALATVSWCQCLHYGKGYSVKSVWAIFIVLCGIFAGFEVGSVYALWVRFTDQSARLIELLTFWVGILGRAPKRSGVANLDVWISLCCPFGPWAVVSLVKICCPSGFC